jgi:hypothetical protein
MLFDLRSAGRRRTVKGVYLGLALLMFVGFVGFSVGSSGLNGGIVDAITGSKSNNGASDAEKRLQANVTAAQRRTQTSPTDPAAWSALVTARLRLSTVGDNFDPAANSGSGDYTAAGKRQLSAAGAAWDKYMALKPAKPDEGLARQMVQVYLSLSQADKAVGVQQVVTEIDPTQQTFQNLALLAYQAGNIRTGDLAAGKAVDLAPAKDKKSLKQQLDSAKSSAAVQQIQQSQPTPTPTIP